MASLTGPVYVPAPTNPAVARYGLFKATNGPLDLPIHARLGGLQYQTATCSLPTCYEVLCASDVGRGTKTFAGGPTTIVPLPFMVYSSLTCTPVGLTDDDLRGYLYDRRANRHSWRTYSPCNHADSRPAFPTMRLLSTRTVAW